MNILVTGGAGFIGSHLVDELVKKGHKARIFDNLDPQVHPDGKKPDHINPEAEFIVGDVRDRDALKKAIEGQEIVFHEASAVGVGQSQYKLEYYVGVNVMGTATLLDILVNDKHKVQKVVVAASMSSYGEGNFECKNCGIVRPPLRPESQMAKSDWNNYCPECGEAVKPVPTDEKARQNCNSIYAITKQNQEQMVLNIGQTYRLPSVALRYFNVYGPRQSLSNPYTGVAAIFMSRIKNGRRPVVYEDGLQTRDFVSVYDIVRANIRAMENPKADYRTFNIGRGEPLTIKSIAETLAKLYGREDIQPEVLNKFRKGDVRHCYADTTAAREILGFEAKTTFEDGMKDLIEWAKEAEADDRFETAAGELKEKGLI